MKVYVITRKVSVPMDNTDARVIGVVSSQEEAKRILSELEENPYVENCADTDYYYSEYELDVIEQCNLWDNESNIKLKKL